MPANTAGTVDVPLEVFGGTVSDLAPTDLPQGASPDSQDVAFQVGLVKTRPGLQNVFTPIGSNPNINYLKTYITQQQNLRMLTLDSAGNFYKEAPQGTLNVIGTVTPGEYCTSCSQFTREYLAFGDGKFGLDIPRQYDDTNFDRVSQVGPGLAPTAADESVSQSTTTESQPATVAIAAVGVPGASENGFLAKITTTAPHGLVAGQNVVVAGVGVAGYNNGGVNPAFFTILSVPSTTTFTYVLGTSGLANSGGGTAQSTLATYNFASAHGLVVGQLVTTSGIAPGGYNVTAQAIFSVPSSTSLTLNLTVAGLAAGGAGTMANAGSVVAGVHKISVVFKTRQGYITAPAPPVSWTAAGGKRVVVTNIPTGPSNIIARILIFTLATGNSYYYLTGVPQIFSSNFIINDNVTTTATVDFTDAILAAGTSADYLFRLVELGECSGVIDYGLRNFWWGERNKVQNFVNLTFDGGFNPLGSGVGPNVNYPLGWTVAVSTGLHIAAGSVWGGAYQALGDGATATIAQITQGAFQDINQVRILQDNTAYSVRFRARFNISGITPVAGRIVIDVQSPTGGVLGSATLVVGSLGTSFAETIATLITAQVIPSDAVLRLYVDSTLTLNSQVEVDNIEVYPTLQPFNTSLVRGSRVEDPESYDGVNGFMQFGENDGTRVTSAFKLRNNLYFVKERSLWQTTDDGVNEPSKWTINQISTIIGTPSNHGVGIGSDWVVIAGRLGLYFYDGGEPEKISQEIQKPVITNTGTQLAGWDSINWQYGHTLWCLVDEKQRRIYVGAPVFNATHPNVVFVLDYRGLDTGKDITAHKSIHVSAYTGKIYDIADSRKWTRWNMTINSSNQIERTDGTFHIFMGNGTLTGRIYDLLDVENFTTPSQFSDDGSAINSYYDTYFFLRPQEEEQFQLGSHRKLYHYLTTYVEGQGALLLTAFSPGNGPGIVLPQSGNSLPLLVSPLYPVTISSISLTNNVVTVVTAAAHNLSGTSVVVINGTLNSVFDGNQFGNLTIINTTSFTFPLVNPNIAAINAGNVNPLTRDLETPQNILTERLKYRIQTDAVGAWFSLRTLTPSIKTDPWAPVRGVN